ncbi:MAG: FAD-dependent oxidoreductase, partial [bacterium]
MNNCKLEIAPCVDKCPINLPIPDYIRLTCEGRFDEAYSLIVRETPIPSILGRICFHPCEDVCRRGDVDEAISICNIKRFLGDTISSLPKQKVFQKERIAVIGGGPSGLSCAWHLLQLGYRVDVFEEKGSAGGMPYITIPSWRLPLDILKREMINLVDAGLSIKTNKRFGDDFSLDDLKKEYDAVVIACGLPLSREIKAIKGDDVILALEFLEAIKFKREVSLKKRVLVIGGGNVAIDCARASLRMKRDVSLVCLEDYENMPCFKGEKIKAEEEGVKIFPELGPKELIRDNGKIKQLIAMKVLKLFDENKRFSPQFNEDEIKTFDVDTIIMAIGQMADWTALKRGGITQDMLKEDGLNGLFACGDIVLGPTNV